MKNKILSILIFGLGFLFQINAQIPTICLGDDYVGCPGDQVQIDICNAGLDSNTQLNLDNPTIIPQLTDDVWSGVHPIGFSFNFYGNYFTQFIIGSNGLLSFNINQAGQSCPYSLTGVGTLPSTGGGSAQAARNSIMGAYTDINPSAAGNVGNIQYQTIGEAPNRMLVVLFREIGAFSCNQTVCHNFSIILFETSNVIEVHIGSKPICGTWNGGLAIQGLQNNAGTVAHITPGRNNSQWTAYEDGRRFTPDAPLSTNNYTITEVDYLHVTGAGSSIVWANTLGETFPYGNGLLIATVPSSDSVGYYLSGTSCGLAIGALSDMSYLSSSSASVDFDIINDACFSSIGAISANVAGTSPPFNLTWNNGQTGNAISNLLAGTYILSVLDSLGCETSFEAIVEDEVGLLAAFGEIENVSCFGFSDGAIQMAVTGGTAPYTYAINNTPNGNNSLFGNLAAGEYEISVTDASGCTADTVLALTEPELIPATISYPTAPVCSYENANPIIVGVQGGSYSSSPAGLGLINTGDLAGVITGPNSQPGTYTVVYSYTNPNGCEYSAETTVIVNPPVPLNAGENVTICQGDTYTLNGQGALTYQWLNGTANGQNVTPPLGTTNYIVIGTDENGCQAIDTVSVTVNPYPTISFVADTAEGLPGTQINFTNTSSSDATNFLWNFGNGATQQNNSIDVSSVYLSPGEYYVVLAGDNQGCEAMASAMITIYNFDPPIIVTPNVFSPNNDNINDEWTFKIFENVKEVEFVIMNRWGNVIYETSLLDIVWDGKLQDGSLANDGVYFYKYKVLGMDNEEYMGHGSLTLVRE